MMQYEFERIAGYEVTYEDYTKIIEPMYNATDLDKFDFVKVIDRKRFDIKAKQKKMIKEMKVLAQMLKETCIHYTNWEAKEKLEKLAEEFKDMIGAYDYFISDEEHSFSTCYYPTKITFTNESFRNLKTIELF